MATLASIGGRAAQRRNHRRPAGAEQRSRPQARDLDLRKACHTLEHARICGRDLRVVDDASLLEVDRDHDHLVESVGKRVAKALNARDEQASRDDQRQREPHLQDERGLTEVGSSLPGDLADSEVRRWIGARRLNRGHGAAHDDRYESKRRQQGKRSAVEYRWQGRQPA